MRSACSGNARDFHGMLRRAWRCFAVEKRGMPLGCKRSLVQIQSPRPSEGPHLVAASGQQSGCGSALRL